MADARSVYSLSMTGSSRGTMPIRKSELYRTTQSAEDEWSACLRPLEAVQPTPLFAHYCSTV